MTARCSPGRRLLAENGNALELCTMSGVVAQGEQWWGITAGHALQNFSDGQRVWFFPEAERSLLGAYVAPAAVQPNMDLAKFQVPHDLVSLNPIGFGQPPQLLPEADLQSLVTKRVVFLGGQVGRISGTVTSVTTSSGHSRAILVRLACADLLLGDSGGPLYREEGTELLWVGSLVGNRELQNQPGFTEGLFLHPGQALGALGIG